MARVPAQVRRKQLVDAAFRVIGKEGFTAATTRRICSEAGASLASFHYCFASKEELLVELTRQTQAEMTSRHAAEVEIGGSVEASVRATLRGYWETVEEDPNRESVLMALTQHALHEPALAGVAAQQYVEYHRVAQVSLERIAAACEVRWTLPVEQIARMLVVVTDGVTLAWLVDGNRDAALTALDAFADGLARFAEPSH